MCLQSQNEDPPDRAPKIIRSSAEKYSITPPAPLMVACSIVAGGIEKRADCIRPYDDHSTKINGAATIIIFFVFTIIREI
jgi:hypothetical protein